MKKYFVLLLLIITAQLLFAQQDCDDITGDITPVNPSICEGGSVQLTATGGSSYEWRRNNEIIEGVTGNTFNATQAGTYSVIIIEGECAVPATNTTTVTVNPLPSGNISPNGATICAGGSQQLTATGGTSYTWFLNGSEIVGETGAVYNATQAGTYTAIINADGCSAPASNSVVVELITTPTGTISPATGAICAGGTIELTATGGDSYTWFRDGVEINGRKNATLEVDATGTYTVIIHQDDCSGPASNSSVITTATAPTGTISPATAAICSGGSTVLTATGGESYTWFRNGSEINGQDDATLNVTQPGTYSVTIHQGGCSGPAANTSVVTVTAAPTGTLSPANASICAGNSVELTATGGSSYTWFRNGNEIAGETGATLNASQAGTYSVIIEQNGCSGPASNNSVVTVASSPTGSISPAAASICPGGSQELTVTGGTSYTWFLNGVEIENETGSSLTATQAGIYTVTIHQGDCSGPAANSVVVALVPIPVGTISPATGSICTGGNITLTATGGTSYTWYRNGTEIPGETDATLNATEAGTYFAIIKQGTCSGPALNTSVITLASAPTGNITPATAAICAGGSTELTASGGTSYIWFRNGNAIAGENDATLTVNQAGTYTVTIQQGNCSGPAANNAVVTVAAAPTGNISPATGSICEGGSLLLTASGGTSYSWFRDGVAIGGATGSTLSVTQSGTYTANIQQGNCTGPAANSSVVTVGSAPTGTITPAAAAICSGKTQVLTATGGTSYAWLRDGVEINGEVGPTITVAEAGTYSVIIKNGNCTAEASNTATVTIESGTGERYPDVSARPNVPVQLNARDVGATYEWIPATGVSNPGVRNPTVTTNTQREYVVKINTTGGCVIIDSVLVKVTSVIFIPTAFSPDGNGTNDVLRPLGEIANIDYFRVYNRWGQMMYQTTAIGSGWDGRFKGANQPSDTYTWHLAGTDANGQPIKLSGKTLLIR